MRVLPAAGLMLAAAESMVLADDIVVSKPGIMCNSSQALSRLTLPGGDSRTHQEPTLQKYLDIATAGGCRDLQIGQRLGVVKSFRNTVIVSLKDEGGGHGSSTLVAPLIDFDQAATMPHAGDASLAPDPIMDVPIGMGLADFVRIHGVGSCVDSADGGKECYYSGKMKSNCPAEFSCYATIYEFVHGALVAFHTQLISESDWVQLYRLTLATFGSPVTTTAAWGMSTSFNTRVGVLDFARKAGPPPSWHVTLSYRP